jgi:hypothetical protein
MEGLTLATFLTIEQVCAGEAHALRCRPLNDALHPN